MYNQNLAQMLNIILRKMQIKTTTRHYTPTGIANPKGWEYQMLAEMWIEKLYISIKIEMDKCINLSCKLYFNKVDF